MEPIEQIEHLQWPLKVFIQAADSNFTGIATSDLNTTLAFIHNKLVNKEIFLLDPVDNFNVVVAVQPISEVCAEIHIVSTDGTFALFTELRKLLKKNRQFAPKKIVVKVSDESFFPLLKRYGFFHEATMREYGPQGKDLYYWSLIIERAH